MSSPFASNIYHLFTAAGTTLSIALCSLVLGLILAMLLTLWESVKIKPIALSCTLLMTMIRGLPEIIIVLFVYYGFSNISLLLLDGFTINLYFTQITLQTDSEISPFFCAVIALGLLYAAYASQTLRGAIKAIPSGQWESGQALGLSKHTIFMRLIMPQMWRHALPGLGNQWLILLKDTALVSLISINDIMMQSENIAVNTKESFTWYLIAALLYLVISMFSQFLLKKISNRANRYVERHA